MKNTPGNKVMPYTRPRKVHPIKFGKYLILTSVSVAKRISQRTVLRSPIRSRPDCVADALFFLVLLRLVHPASSDTESLRYDGLNA